MTSVVIGLTTSSARLLIRYSSLFQATRRGHGASDERDGPAAGTP
jgi:hypothetical protein